MGVLLAEIAPIAKRGREACDSAMPRNQPQDWTAVQNAPKPTSLNTAHHAWQGPYSRTSYDISSASDWSRWPSRPIRSRRYIVTCTRIRAQGDASATRGVYTVLICNAGPTLNRHQICISYLLYTCWSKERKPLGTILTQGRDPLKMHLSMLMLLMLWLQLLYFCFM